MAYKYPPLSTLVCAVEIDRACCNPDLSDTEEKSKQNPGCLPKGGCEQENKSVGNPSILRSFEGRKHPFTNEVNENLSSVQQSGGFRFVCVPV